MVYPTLYCLLKCCPLTQLYEHMMSADPPIHDKLHVIWKYFGSQLLDQMTFEILF